MFPKPDLNAFVNVNARPLEKGCGEEDSLYEFQSVCFDPPAAPKGRRKKKTTPCDTSTSAGSGISNSDSSSKEQQRKSKAKLTQGQKQIKNEIKQFLQKGKIAKAEAPTPAPTSPTTTTITRKKKKPPATPRSASWSPSSPMRLSKRKNVEYYPPPAPIDFVGGGIEYCESEALPASTEEAKRFFGEDFFTDRDTSQQQPKQMKQDNEDEDYGYGDCPPALRGEVRLPISNQDINPQRTIGRRQSLHMPGARRTTRRRRFSANGVENISLLG